MEERLARQKFTLSKKVLEGSDFNELEINLSNEKEQHIFLITAYLILIHKYTDHEIFKICCNDYSERGEVIFSINRDEGLNFSELYYKVKESLGKGKKEILQEDLEREFPMHFAIHERFNESLDYTDLNNDSIRPESRLDKFRISLQMFHNKGIFGGWFLFRTNTFDTFMADRMRDHFVNIVLAVLEDPRKNISSINMLSLHELNEIFNEWQGPVVDYPVDGCLHKKLGHVFSSYPDSVALIQEDQQLSFRQLNSRANYIANILKQMGVQQGDKVGVLIDLSFDAIAGIIGALKAGAVFVAMDPAHPENRNMFIIEDCDIQTLVTTSVSLKNISFSSERTVFLDEEKHISGMQDNFDDVDVPLDQPAYVMYTSGSTGQPKGVLIYHTNIVHNLYLTAERYEIGYGDRVISMTSLSFDATISKLFTTLFKGAALVLPTPEDVMDVDRILAMLQKHKPRFYPSTPPVLRLINQLKPDLSHVGVISTGGEPVKYSDIDHIIKSVKIINVYGPTEATVSSACYTIPLRHEDGDRIPIGRPNPNCHIYILDKHLNPVPAGVYGTLFISGKGISGGYLNNPEKTGEKFIKNPFIPGEMMYNSGDIARWLPDGMVDFAGRKDNQVKIRTFRVELEEVENALSMSGMLIDCKVLIKQEANDEHSMLAFVVPKNRNSFSAKKLKSFVLKQLPSPIVPNEYVELDKLPVNRSNKIDSKALLEIYLLQKSKKNHKNSDVQYNNQIEKEIADFWKVKLFRTGIAGHENFFQLGGHSLQVMQLKLHIQKLFKVDIPVKAIFENPTTEKLAAFIVRFIGDSGLQPLWLSKDSGTDTQAVLLQEPEHIKMHHVKTGRWEITTRLKNKLARAPRLKDINIALKNSVALTNHEERLWFLYKFQPDQCMYNIAKAYELKGNLDTEALAKALKKVVNKHDNLRKIFKEVEGEPVAVIRSGAYFKLALEDYRNSSDSQDLTRIYIEKESQKPFDLSEDSLVRATLIRQGEHENLLLITTHHIISDGWSFDILMDDLNQFYQAEIYNQKIIPELLSEQYKNYPIVYKQMMDSESMKQQAEYWKNQLAGRIEKLNLPYDKNVSVKGKGNGGYEELMLPSTLVDKLNQLAGEAGTTAFTVYLSAFQCLLQKYTGQEYVHVGIPVADRDQEAFKRLVGFFVNTLLITAERKDASFLQILEMTKEEVVNAFSNKDLPFGTLSEIISKESGLKGEDLVQVMFNYQSSFGESLKLGPLEVKDVQLKNQYAKFDITINLCSGEDGILMFAEYKRNLFEPSTIIRFLKSFLKVLECIAEDPNIHPGSIEMIGQDEKNMILHDWNNTYTEIPASSVHVLFEEQAAAHPDAIALVTDSGSFSYREINEKANMLAHKLKSFNLKKEELIGVYMPESEDSIIAQIAILKAGAGFVPMDTTYPVERLEYMIQQCRIKHVLTHKAFDKSFTQSQINYQLMDEPGIFETGNAHNPGLDIDSSGIAYVMFTSGSTGRPKAVAIEHRGIVRLVKNTNYVNLNSSSRILKTGAFSFDASTFEIWGALLNGGSLYLYPKENLLDHSFVKQKIKEQTITHAWFTSSWFNQLADLDKKMFAPLKYLLAGGDKLSTVHVNMVKRACPELTIINGYGPTENTTFSLTHTITKEQDDPIPIGKPIANSTVYILDDKYNMTPVGVPGELYVGGYGVARGYVNDPELTASRFVENPFRPGERMYKTGDLGRWLNNGLVEFMGRNDHQVKIRGYRIEPGEIENALAAHPLVDDCAVIVKEIAGEKRLIAFYKSDEEIENSELYDFLKQTLTEAMVPSSFNFLEEIPLTPNGKTDRKKLSGMETRVMENRIEVKPSNQVEEKLSRIFGELLGTEMVGVTENFFHAGGHSLMATKLMARIDKAFNKTLPLSLLFQAPTVRDLAAIISGPDFNSVGLVPIQPKGNRTPIFLLPGYLFYFNLSKCMGNNQPLYGFEPIPKFKTEEIAAHYIEQIKAIQPEGPYFIGGYCASGILAMEMAQQMLAAGEELGWLALFETYTPEATVAKNSGQYLGDKLTYWKAGFLSSSWKGRYKLVANETGKLFNYFFKNTFRKILNDYKIKHFSGKMVLFKAGDGMVGSAGDPYMGWSNYCDTNNIIPVTVPGDHNTIFKEPNVQLIADKLKECMDMELERRTEYRNIG